MGAAASHRPHSSPALKLKATTMTAVGQSQKSVRAVAATKKSFGLERSQKLWGIAFLSPWIIGFLAFTLVPMVASLAFSFTDFDLLNPDQIQFIGFANYTRLFSDPQVASSARASLLYSVIALPVAILSPILMAALLSSKSLWLRRLFTTLFYMPYMVPVVSAAFIWQGFLNEQTGWLNRILDIFGIAGPNWINSVEWIYPALVLIGLWGIGNAMLITLAGMQGVPTELYEAARVDGANRFTTFFRITIPIISPVIFYNLILTVIGLFRYFELPYILGRGQGQPGGATYFYNIHLYKNAFTYQDMGYGSTLAWVLFMAAMLVTGFLFLTSRFWVYYGNEERG